MFLNFFLHYFISLYVNRPEAYPWYLLTQYSTILLPFSFQQIYLAVECCVIIIETLFELNIKIISFLLFYTRSRSMLQGLCNLQLIKDIAKKKKKKRHGLKSQGDGHESIVVFVDN